MRTRLGGYSLSAERVWAAGRAPSVRSPQLAKTSEFDEVFSLLARNPFRKLTLGGEN